MIAKSKNITTSNKNLMISFFKEIIETKTFDVKSVLERYCDENIKVNTKAIKL